MPDNVISMDVVRRLAVVSARISSGSDLTSTLQAVAEGVVDVVGFGMAVVNHRLPSGDLAVVAVTGPDDVKAALMGKVYPRAAMDSCSLDPTRGAVFASTRRTGSRTRRYRNGCPTLLPATSPMPGSRGTCCWHRCGLMTAI